MAPATWSLFGVVWPAGVALAEQMQCFAVNGRRVLEVGCGLALPSLALRRRGAEVIACDHHPLAGEFLAYNCALNGLAPIPFHRARWQEACPALGRFDLIIGADLLYEPDQPALLAGFIGRHAHARTEVIVADPGRAQRGRFAALMRGHGDAHSTLPCGAAAAEAPRGSILRFTRD